MGWGALLVWGVKTMDFLKRIPRKFRDLAARAGWAALWAALSVVTVESLNLPAPYVPMFALVLSTIKSFVATKVGNPAKPTATFKDPNAPEVA